MKIARVFPRRTSATPDDADAYTSVPDLFTPQYDEVHISVTWTWDMDKANQLADAWQSHGKVILGGPAFGKQSGDFIPGMYLKNGYTVTSRGCPNTCWFCSVPKREGGIRELPIKDGWNILDDNLLACSDLHVSNVFSMLKRQSHRAEFTGGLEAKILRDFHVGLLADLKPKQMFFAYDTADDLDPLFDAGRLLQLAGICSDSMRCYVLIGFPGDTIDKAEHRMNKTIDAGFFPMAMLWRDECGRKSHEWAKFQREWARMPIIRAKRRVKS